jgi:hypothetical protein
MSDFAERLPWRLGALAGLLVGAVSIIAGIDLWSVCLRAGAALVVFWGLGMGLRALLRHGLVASTSKAKLPPEKTSTTGEPGSHVDEKTPEMTVDDL